MVDIISEPQLLQCDRYLLAIGRSRGIKPVENSEDCIEYPKCHSRNLGFWDCIRAGHLENRHETIEFCVNVLLAKLNWQGWSISMSHDVCRWIWSPFSSYVTLPRCDCVVGWIYHKPVRAIRLYESFQHDLCANKSIIVSTMSCKLA